MLVFEWDDLPHVMCLTLLPLAVWFLWRALVSRRWLDFGVTCFLMAAMMLASMFGMVLIVFTVITVPLAIGASDNTDAPVYLSNFVKAAATAACAYIFVCPWAPPSLILKIRSNSVMNYESAPTSTALIALALVVLVCAVVYSGSHAVEPATGGSAGCSCLDQSCC